MFRGSTVVDQEEVPVRIIGTAQNHVGFRYLLWTNQISVFVTTSGTALQSARTGHSKALILTNIRGVQIEKLDRE